MENQQNINFTQTEVEALLEIINYIEEKNRFKEFESYIEIEIPYIKNKLNTFEFEEE